MRLRLNPDQKIPCSTSKSTRTRSYIRIESFRGGTFSDFICKNDFTGFPVPSIFEPQHFFQEHRTTRLFYTPGYLYLLFIRSFQGYTTCPAFDAKVQPW